MQGSTSGCYIIDADYNIVNVNEAAKIVYPQLEVGKKCYACLMALDHPCGPCPVAAGREGPNTYVDPLRNILETVDAVKIPYPGHGDCRAMVIGTMGENALLTATLPTSPQELLTLALVKALTVDNSDVYSVNIRKDTATMFRHNYQSAEPVQTFTYTESNENYISTYVIPEDQPMMRAQTSLAHLEQALKEKEMLILHYRVRYQGEQHYFYRRIARIGEADSFESFSVGVGCEDEAVRNLEDARSMREIAQDPVTGLYNKKAFFRRCEQLMATCEELSFDLIVICLENLGALNHQLGRKGGDRVLAGISEKMLELRLDNSAIGYMGAGMFVSIFPSQEPKKLKLMMDAFR